MKGISVIMPVTFRTYQDSASNIKAKFTRAVDSFLSQKFTNKELVIVSDNDEDVLSFFKEKYSEHSAKIKAILYVNSNLLWSGMVRHVGIEYANYNTICYLDADDYFGKENHLAKIYLEFEKNDKIKFVYFQHYKKHVADYNLMRTTINYGCIGVSNIAHLKGLGSWGACNGYGHDFKFIESALKTVNEDEIVKSNGMSYVVCHIPKGLDV